MKGHMSGGQFVRLDDGDMHFVLDGKPGAPVLLLIHGSTASTASWNPVVPALASTCQVVRVDLLGHGKSSTPAGGGYDIPVQARRVGAALDRLGVSPVTVIGHSMGCMVATALAEQRRDAVAALGLIDMAPSLDARNPESLLVRLLLAQFPGRLLWRLRSADNIRKTAARTALARPVDIPDDMIQDTLGMTYRAFAATARAALDYMRQRSLPDRIASLDLPLMVIFGAEDPRYRSSSAEEYRLVPGARVELLAGVGHMPMLEDPQATSKLLLDFAVAARRGHPG